MALVGAFSSTQIIGRPVSLESANRPFTLTGWFRWPSASSAQSFFHSALCNRSLGTTYSGLLIYYSGTGPTFGVVPDEKDNAGTENYVFNYYGTNTTSPPGSNELTNNTWYFGAVIYAGLSSRSAYTSQYPISGVTESLLTSTGSNAASTYDTFCIGQVPFLGSDIATSPTHIAEVAWFGTALSLAQLQYLAQYNSPTSLHPSANLISYYPLRGNLKDYGPDGIGLGDLGSAATSIAYTDHPPVILPVDRSYLIYRYVGVAYSAQAAAISGTENQAAIDATRALLAAARQATQAGAQIGAKRGVLAATDTPTAASGSAAAKRAALIAGAIATQAIAAATAKRQAQAAASQPTDVNADIAAKRAVISQASSATRNNAYLVAIRGVMAASLLPTSAASVITVTRGFVASVCTATNAAAVALASRLTTAPARSGTASTAALGTARQAAAAAGSPTRSAAPIGAVRAVMAAADTPTVAQASAGAIRRLAAIATTATAATAAATTRRASMALAKTATYVKAAGTTGIAFTTAGRAIIGTIGSAAAVQTHHIVAASIATTATVAQAAAAQVRHLSSASAAFSATRSAALVGIIRRPIAAAITATVMLALAYKRSPPTPTISRVRRITVAFTQPDVIVPAPPRTIIVPDDE